MPFIFQIYLIRMHTAAALDGLRLTGERTGTETGRNGKGTVPVWALKMNGPFTVPFLAYPVHLSVRLADPLLFLCHSLTIPFM